MHSRNKKDIVNHEAIVKQLQDQFKLNKGQTLVLLANVLASSILDTPQQKLTELFGNQTNRLSFRRLDAVLNTLNKLGYLRLEK